MVERPLSEHDRTVDKPVSGPLYGWPWPVMSSTLGMAVIGVVGNLAWESTLVLGVVLLVLSILGQRRSRASASEDGLEVTQSGLIGHVTASTPWRNVTGLKAGMFSASVSLKEPVRFGLRSVRKLPIAIFDPKWRKRPLSRAVLACLDRDLD